MIKGWTLILILFMQDEGYLERKIPYPTKELCFQAMKIVSQMAPNANVSCIPEVKI